jgi:hypothetical protein
MVYGRVAQPKTQIVIGIVIHLLRVCDHLRAFALEHARRLQQFLQTRIRPRRCVQSCLESGPTLGIETEVAPVSSASASPRTLRAAAARLLVLTQPQGYFTTGAAGMP